MARDGFSQAGDFFARAMRMQNAASIAQAQQQNPAFNQMSADEQNVPGAPLFQRPAPATMPALEKAAMGSPTAQPSAIISELLTRAKQKRAQVLAEGDAQQATMTETPTERPIQPTEMSGGYPPVETEYRPMFGRRMQNSARAGQLTS